MFLSKCEATGVKAIQSQKWQAHWCSASLLKGRPPHCTAGPARLALPQEGWRRGKEGFAKTHLIEMTDISNEIVPARGESHDTIELRPSKGVNCGET
jgi:hypothetical protein